MPSDVGLKFYIASEHVRRSVTIFLATIHIMPFEKEYVVIFALAAPAGDRMTAAAKETAAKVFDSFHVRGERPVR